MILTNR
jgi:hypothetical protein